MEIREVPWQATLKLRSEVLRPGLPIEKSHFPGDDAETTFHLAALIDSDVAGIATFFPEASPLFSARHPYRLRGMAVDPTRRRAGIGRQLVLAGEKKLRGLACDLLWFNAREAAFDFYVSLGYRFASDMFEIEGVGPHKVMYKKF